MQDKFFLPGLLKLKMAIASGFLGRLLSVRGEFGYWVFEGDRQPAQRPSWNYKKAEGGGVILDTLCHWRYVLDALFGEMKAVSCLGTTHIPRRFDEQSRAYQADADAAAYATFELEGGVIAQINSSWTTRVRRDDLVTFHVDGTHGSAVAGLTTCRTQSRVNTPKPVWSPDTPQPIDVFQGREEIPDTQAYLNGFRAEWELFLCHVAGDVEHFPGTCSPPSRACKWPRPGCAPGRSGAGSTFRCWRSERWQSSPFPPATARSRRSRQARPGGSPARRCRSPAWSTPPRTSWSIRLARRTGNIGAQRSPSNIVGIVGNPVCSTKREGPPVQARFMKNHRTSSSSNDRFRARRHVS